MKLTFTSGLLLLGGTLAFAQIPQVDSWMLNTTGATASYDYYPGPPPTTSTVNLTDSADVLTVCTDDDYVYIRANGLASYHMGPWEMNPNEPAADLHTYRFPLDPQEETGTKTSQPEVGALGIAINGVQLYGIGDARSYKSSTNENAGDGDGIWYADAWVSEGATMDAGGNGHADGMSTYHYHANPSALYSDPSTEHSPIIGWAFDGFPIYGPFGYANPMDASSPVVRMESGYELRTMSDRTTLPDGSTSTPPGPSDFGAFPLGTYQQDYEFTDAGDLDEYNGRFCITPDFPSGIYCYFLATDGSGDPAFPYLTGFEYYGTVSVTEIGPMSGNITIPSGTCADDLSTPENATEFLSVYPNPVINQLNFDGVTSGTYQIFDQLGREVMNGIVEDSYGVNVSTLTPGTYLIQILSEEKKYFSRFIKE